MLIMYRNNCRIRYGCASPGIRPSGASRINWCIGSSCCASNASICSYASTTLISPLQLALHIVTSIVVYHKSVVASLKVNRARCEALLKASFASVYHSRINTRSYLPPWLFLSPRCSKGHRLLPFRTFLSSSHMPESPHCSSQLCCRLANIKLCSAQAVVLTFFILISSYLPQSITIQMLESACSQSRLHFHCCICGH